jgi:hypothetical protein
MRQVLRNSKNCIMLQESPLSGDKSHESRPSPDGDGGEETETAPEADDEVCQPSNTVLWIWIRKDPKLFAGSGYGSVT